MIRRKSTSKSENTKRAYQYDFNQYLAFCKDNALLAMSSDINVTKESHHTPKNCFSALFYWGERITGFLKHKCDLACSK
jgi:hypothetical protein